MLSMNKLEFSSLTDSIVWISETIGVWDGFLSGFPLFDAFLNSDINDILRTFTCSMSGVESGDRLQGIDSVESMPRVLKCLKMRALISKLGLFTQNV